jgi:hypothetical protein
MGENITTNITSLLMQIIERYSGTIASFALVIIALYYNHKTLKLSMKDRERHRIIELLRFCIVPLKKLLESQIGRVEFEEFNMEKLFSTVWDPQKPDPMLLCVEFSTLLEKLQKKNDWDERVTRYNGLFKEFSKKENDLKQKLKELVDDNLLLLKDRYEKTDAKNCYNFDNFKRELINDFFYCYKNKQHGSGLSGAWYYVGDQVFNDFEAKLGSLLIEINKVIEEKNALLKSLIDLLENVCKRLREDYQLTPLEQMPLIELNRSILRKP